MNKILLSKDIRSIDEATIVHEPVLSIDLMERAAKQLADFLLKSENYLDPFVIVAGPGNNGGDAVALYRLLQSQGFNSQLIICNPTDKFSADCQINIQRLLEKKIPFLYCKTISDFPSIDSSATIIDGIFGTGLNKPVEGFYAEIIRKLNVLSNQKISIDMPSGLFDDFCADDNFLAVKATQTLSFQFPKPSFFYPENEPFVGRWYILDINLLPEAISNAKTHRFWIEDKDLRILRKSRSRFSHKGTFGHSLIVAGSEGKWGAMILCCKTCLRSGAGLVSAVCSHDGRISLNSSCPEIMTIDNLEIATLSKFNSIAIGPGIGTSTDKVQLFSEILTHYDFPMVIDADAINILSENKELLADVPKNSILTPHIGEFDRLCGKSSNQKERLEKAREFSSHNQIIVVLKGAFTAIVEPSGNIYFNNTGNPGMATAGSGDVLTGLIAGLLSCSYKPLDAAILGVWLHGRAGDLALYNQSVESMIAGDLIDHIGKAFNSIH
ncbi:MAG TPA: NAD(P)H-hydrate dehydratase [Salinivirgaceae bacterium]|nr:NAD(P)H-hydrate dehydratase [Salinivirgaceae bacterium]